jgi:hypothetical protein
MATVLLAIMIALPLVGAVIYGGWLASARGVAATSPRRTHHVSRLGPHEGISLHGDP